MPELPIRHSGLPASTQAECDPCDLPETTRGWSSTAAARGRTAVWASSAVSGVPKRGRRITGSLPDRIELYRVPIVQVCGSREELADRVRNVLGHEIGYAVGLQARRCGLE